MSGARPQIRKNKWRVIYQDENELEDGTCPVSAPVGVTDKSTHQREDVDSPSPFADVVSSISILLLEDPSQK